MYPPTTSTMRIDRIEPSRRRKDRVLVFLEGGDLLRVTEQELLVFGLRPGLELPEQLFHEKRRLRRIGLCAPRLAAPRRNPSRRKLALDGRVPEQFRRRQERILPELSFARFHRLPDRETAAQVRYADPGQHRLRQRTVLHPEKALPRRRRERGGDHERSGGALYCPSGIVQHFDLCRIVTRLRRFGQLKFHYGGFPLFQPEAAFLAGFSFLGKAGGAHGGGLEMLVALAAASAPDHQIFVARFRKIGQHMLAFGGLLEHERAHGQVEDQILALAPVALAAQIGRASCRERV